MKLFRRYIENLLQRGTLKVKIVGRPIDLNYQITGGNWLQRLIQRSLSSEDKQILIDGKVAEMVSEFNQKMIEENKRNEANFSLNNLNVINLNLWDEINDDGSVMMYIEEWDLPLSFQRDCLEFIQAKIDEVESLSSFSLACHIKLHDSAIDYPGLIGGEGEYSLFRRWDLMLRSYRPLTPQVLDNITQVLRVQKWDFKGVPLKFYSES